MAIFAGIQSGYSAPTIHESPGITSGTQPTYAGAQPGVTPPVVTLWLKRMDWQYGNRERI